MNKRHYIAPVFFLLTTSWLTAHAAPTVYIPLGSGNQVIAVDAATDTITDTFPGVINAHGLVATPDGEYLIAGSLAERTLGAGEPKDAANSKLYLVHPGHGHVMSEMQVSGWTHHQAITPDGRYILSTHPTRGAVSVVDLHSNQVITTIATGPSPNYTVVTSDGKYAYVSNSGNGTISEIDLQSWAVTRALDAGPAPEHLVMSGDEQRLYVTNPRAGTVSEVEISSGKVRQSYPIGRGVHGLDLGDDGYTLFASSKKDDKLVAVDTRSGATRNLTLAPAPYHLNTIRGTGKVYVSSRKQPTIWVIDQQQFKIVGEITLPAGEGHQMAIVND
jgi:YVTN family beta-propeller protein